MTLKYKLLGIPGDLDEFLDRESEKYGNRDLKITVRMDERFRFFDRYISSVDLNREFKVARYRAQEDQLDGIITNKEFEYSEGFRNIIEKNDADLVEMLKKKGFNVLNYSPKHTSGDRRKV